MKNFVQISTILLLFNKIEIWTKLFISGNIESTNNADHFLEMPGLGELCDNCFKNHTWQDKGNFVIIISRNLLLRLGWQMNAANYIKNQDDIQVVLHTSVLHAALQMEGHLLERKVYI